MARQVSAVAGCPLSGPASTSTGSGPTPPSTTRPGAADAVRDVRGHRGGDDREVPLPLGELGEHRALGAGSGNQISVIISSGPAAVL